MGFTAMVARAGTSGENDSDYDVLGIVGTSRLSIDYTMERLGQDLPLANHVGNLYDVLPADRRRVSDRLLQGPLLECFPGLSMIRNPL